MAQKQHIQYSIQVNIRFFKISQMDKVITFKDFIILIFDY
jgi:hypothetical protein